MSTRHPTPRQIVDTMFSRDKFSEWLGLEIDEVRVGYCRLQYVVREDMLNGFRSVHGGILFSAADSALAFASATHGRIAVALDVSITFTRPAKPGDVLLVEANELYLGNKVAVYDIRTTSQTGDLIAAFKGTVYRTSELAIW